MSNRLVVNGVELDIDSNIAFPLSFSIADIKDPQKRKRNLSKSIKIVGKQTNLNFFSSTYSLTLSDVDGSDVGFTFDPTQRVTAKYYKDSILVFDGLLQLNDVVFINKTYVFNCTLFSNFIDIFFILADLKVSELGWSEYDHLLTRTIIENSFATSVILNGVATPNFTAGVPNGFGYVYPLVDYGYNSVPTTFITNNLIPLVYIREVIQKCLTLAGISFSSAFLDSDLVKKMVLGFEGGKRLSFSLTELNQRKIIFAGKFYALAEITSFVNENGYNYTSTENYRIFSNPYFTEVVTSDLTNQYDDTTGLITINQSGTYNFTASIPIEQQITTSFAPTLIDAQRLVSIDIRRNGSIVNTVSFTELSDALIAQTYSFNQTLSCNSGDVISFDLTIQTSLTYEEEGTVTVETQNLIDATVSVSALNVALLDNDNVELSTVIPDLKCSDFLAGFIKMFNLYISDPDIYGDVIIEPLSDYYSATNDFDDWTNIIDYNKEFKIVPSSTIEGKNYLFEFQPQDDYDNQFYVNEFGNYYGNKKYVVQSTFQTGDREYKVPFGQAVPIQITNSNIVLPRIVKFNNNVFEPFKGKPKIYFYNGLKSGNWKLKNVTGSGQSNRTTYPSVHHFDNYQNPTFDLNFELPKRIFYGNSSTFVTTDNVFSRYHERFIKEITGRDSKIIECYAKLTNAQINTLDFAKLIMLNGVLFRLNEVKEFDSDVANSTQIELIKIIEASNPVTNSVIGPLGKNNLIKIIKATGAVVNVINGGYLGSGINVPIKKG
jgi:hypothetical protein